MQAKQAQMNMTGMIVPSSFDPDDRDMRAISRPSDWQWHCTESALRMFAVHGVMMRLPLFWQLEAPLFRACRAAGAFLFINDRGNMPLGAAAIRDARIDCVVTDADDARAFSQYLKEINAPFISWIIVHPAHAATWTLSETLATSRVAQEVHLFPGFPILQQCEALAAEKAPLFHLVEGFTLETIDGHARISGADNDPLPLLRYELPAVLAQRRTCSCGRTMYVRD